MAFVYLREKELSRSVETNPKEKLCCSKGRALTNLCWILAFVKFSFIMKSIMTNTQCGSLI